MRDFQTWLIMQVMVARGAACQVKSELPVCPGYTVYTNQAAEQDNKGHLKQPKPSVPTWFSGYRCHNTELGTCIFQRQVKCQVWPQKIGIDQWSFSSHLTVELSITVDTSSAYCDMQMVESSNLTKVVDQIYPIMTVKVLQLYLFVLC